MYVCSYIHGRVPTSRAGGAYSRSWRPPAGARVAFMEATYLRGGGGEGVCMYLTNDTEVYSTFFSPIHSRAVL